MLVPPWNRLAAEFLPLLAEAGITGLSSMAAREAPALPRGIARINVHVDVVAWKGSREFVGEDAALGGLVKHLRARRLRAVCADEPTGILTHHLIQDEATDAFLDRLITATVAHPAVRWLDAGEIFTSDVLDPG